MPAAGCTLTQMIEVSGTMNVSGVAGTLRELGAVGGSPSSVTRHFHVLSGGTLHVSFLSLTGGQLFGGNTYGGSILVHGSLSLLSVKFSACASSAGCANYGGAVFSQPGSEVICKSSTFSGVKSWGNGGCLYANAESKVSIISTIFENCALTGNEMGGGAIVSSANLTIEGSTFRGNSAPNNKGGAILLFPAPAMTAGMLTVISDTVFENNDAAQDGGAIYLTRGTGRKPNVAQLTSSRFISNTGSSGGAVRVYSGARLELLGGNNFFSQNVAQSSNGDQLYSGSGEGDEFGGILEFMSCRPGTFDSPLSKPRFSYSINEDFRGCRYHCPPGKTTQNFPEEAQRNTPCARDSNCTSCADECSCCSGCSRAAHCAPCCDQSSVWCTEECPAGYYCSGTQGTLPCGESTFSIAGQASCNYSSVSCPADTFASTNTGACEKCPPGKQSQAGATDASDCNEITSTATTTTNTNGFPRVYYPGGGVKCTIDASLHADCKVES